VGLMKRLGGGFRDVCLFVIFKPGSGLYFSAVEDQGFCFVTVDHVLREAYGEYVAFLPSKLINEFARDSNTVMRGAPYFTCLQFDYLDFRHRRSPVSFYNLTYLNLISRINVNFILFLEILEYGGSMTKIEEPWDLKGRVVKIVEADYWFIDIEVGGRRYRIRAECEGDDLSPCEGTTFLDIEEVDEDE